MRHGETRNPGHDRGFSLARFAQKRTPAEAGGEAARLRAMARAPLSAGPWMARPVDHRSHRFAMDGIDEKKNPGHWPGFW
jgi:hypothetical protein